MLTQCATASLKASQSAPVEASDLETSQRPNVWKRNRLLESELQEADSDKSGAAAKAGWGWFPFIDYGYFENTKRQLNAELDQAQRNVPAIEGQYRSQTEDQVNRKRAEINVAAFNSRIASLTDTLQALGRSKLDAISKAKAEVDSKQGAAIKTLDADVAVVTSKLADARKSADELTKSLGDKIAAENSAAQERVAARDKQFDDAENGRQQSLEKHKADLMPTELQQKVFEARKESQALVPPHTKRRG
jgi:hypothetical protein